MLEDGNEPRGGGLGRAALIGALVVAMAAVAVFIVVTIMKPAPEPPAKPQAQAAEPAPPPAPVQVEPAPEPEAAPSPRPRPKKEKPPEPEPAPPPPPAGPSLVIDSDVPGASVFVNREYLGTTPIKTTAVAPGRHQLNASADGQDGIAQAIEVGETGETVVTLRFKEVRLDESIAVVHKHAMGSCDGRLVATPAGLRYESSNKKDAFTLAFKDLEVFEIDYLKKELKVKQRGGRNWNFTDRNDNADKLFVFHRDVSKARAKLGSQEP